MTQHLLSRWTAVGLSLALLSAPAAQALTTEQCAQLLQEIYIDQVPQFVLEQPTVETMVEALGDPYTVYFTPEEYKAFTASMSDTSLVGIGIVYAQTEDGILVDRALEGSPAQKAGLQGGDRILAVDGKSIQGIEINAVSKLIQGEEGTEVNITYSREGRETTVTLTRALVVVPATTSQLIDEHIGYISCTTFGSETVGHFKEALEQYGDKATVWIVDLRSNTGGLTNAATDVAGLFTGAGDMVYFRDGSGKYGAFPYGERASTIYPVIVLVDEHSASASEIFASAIRDRGSGIVVGSRTFGKGVAQSLVDKTYLPDYFADGDAIKITAYRFFSPNGNTTDQVGVIPDLLVAPELIDGVAYLLAGRSPVGSTAGTLRVDLYWQWYVDLNKAKEQPKAFQALLEAIPQGKKIWLGTDGMKWRLSDLEEVVRETGATYNRAAFPDGNEGNHGAALDILKTYHLIQGKEDGLFHPHDTLTRAELCQMLFNALNCKDSDVPSAFSDVAQDAWYQKAVSAMSAMGLIEGVGDGTFHPEDTIDHQQLITILARLAQWLNLSFYDLATDTTETVADVVGLEEYAPWAKNSAWLLSYSQVNYFGKPISLLWAPAHDIDPTAYATREEAAYALYRLLSYTDILPA